MAAMTNAQRQRRFRERHHYGDLFPPVTPVTPVCEPCMSNFRLPLHRYLFESTNRFEVRDTHDTSWPISIIHGPSYQIVATSVKASILVIRGKYFLDNYWRLNLVAMESL